MLFRVRNLKVKKKKGRLVSMILSVRNQFYFPNVLRSPRILLVTNSRYAVSDCPLLELFTFFQLSSSLLRVNKIKYSFSEKAQWVLSERGPGAISTDHRFSQDCLMQILNFVHLIVCPTNFCFVPNNSMTCLLSSEQYI